MTLVPPQDLDAEAELIGAVMLDHDAMERIPYLPAPVFYSERNRLVWRAILDLYEDGKPTDLPLVVAQLKRNGTLDQSGGVAHLAGLVDTAGIGAYATHHADRLLEAYQKREVIRIMNTTAQEAYAEGTQAVQLLAKHEQALTTLARFDSVERGHADYAKEAAELVSGTGGLSTGLLDVDAATGGLVRGGYNVIAARPSMGKSALLRTVLQHRVKEGDKVALFSVDQSGGEIYALTAAARAGVNLAAFRPDRHGRRQASEAEEARFHEETQKLVQLWTNRLTIYDSVSDAARIIQMARREIRAGATVIAVDHLQSLSLDGLTDDTHAVSNISRMFKALSREFNVTVILLSQLGRSVESEPDKRPQMRHLRQSGAIEEDANQILMLFRGDYYARLLDPGAPLDNVMEVLVVKNKLGDVPHTVRVRWQPDRAGVADISRSWQQYD